MFCFNRSVACNEETARRKGIEAYDHIEGYFRPVQMLGSHGQQGSERNAGHQQGNRPAYPAGGVPDGLYAQRGGTHPENQPFSHRRPADVSAGRKYLDARLFFDGGRRHSGSDGAKRL